MLKTNSKQARLNIQAYIKNHFDGCNYGIETPDTFKELSKIILDTFNSEKPACGSYFRMTEQERFEEWAAGLPSRYREQQAETRKTSISYRELVRGCR